MISIGAASKLKKGLNKVGLYPPRGVYNAMRLCLCHPGKEEELKKILKKYPDAVRWEKQGDMLPVAYAVWQRQLGAAEALIKTDPSVMKDRHYNGYNVMEDAVAQGNIPLFNFLKGLGADPLQLDEGGNNLLHLVARRRYHPEMIPLLLAEGADPKARNAKGESPLMLTAGNGGGKILDEFFKLDPDINQRDGRGYTLVMAAADSRDGDGATITRLAAMGADLDATLPDGRTAFDISLARYHAPSAMALIEAGAAFDLDHRGLKPCMDDFRECGDLGFDMLVDEKREEKRLADEKRQAEEAAALAAEKEQARIDDITRAMDACLDGTHKPVTGLKPIQLKAKP